MNTSNSNTPSMPPFAQKVLKKLKRFHECAEDGQGTNIGRHWLDLLVQLALLNRVQRSPALWEITQQGEDLLDQHAHEPHDHEWTDDGQFLLACTKCGAQQDHAPHWRDPDTAPKNGTMLRLLVEFTDHSTEDDDKAITIGHNSRDNTGEDEWQFAGWCWSHDHYTEGKGAVVGWLPLMDHKAEGAKS
ncbi:hypothetical protein [Pseudomonas ovata]|uniref:hypothetical protein n=1 Tax=Pseudomonas ovata TaxID=1839709 RepID=UPI000D691506|nr:hypothetical protein [Pseudomonas ovata]